MNNLFTALLFLMWFFSHVATGKRTRKPLEIDEAIPSRTSGRLTLTTARWFDPVAKSARKWISKAKELLRWVLGYGPLSVPSAQVIRQSYQEFHNQVVDTQTYEGLEEYLVKLGRIAHFSRLFKRYGRDTEEREGFMYRRFPDPIPRKLHKELQANCTQSIFHCIETANHYIKSSR